MIVASSVIQPGRSDLSRGLPYPCPMTAEDQVTVRFFAGARAAAGVDQVMVEPGPLERVIESLHTAFPALTAVTPICSFLGDYLSPNQPGARPVVHAGPTARGQPPLAGAHPHTLAASTQMPAVVCHPGRPWQRPTNENPHGLLRNYFPKGTDLRAHTAEDLARVADELNRRPRKTLGWHTPNALFASLRHQSA